MILYSITYDPKLIPIYIFFIFLVGFLLFEVIKFIIFVIRFTGQDKKPKQNRRDENKN